MVVKIKLDLSFLNNLKAVFGVMKFTASAGCKKKKNRFCALLPELNDRQSVLCFNTDCSPLSLVFDF